LAFLYSGSQKETAHAYPSVAGTELQTTDRFMCTVFDATRQQQRIQVFWVLTLSRTPQTFKMKAIHSFKMLGTNNTVTQHYNPEELNPQHQPYGNLTSHKTKVNVIYSEASKT
jgi:hypothetical protein